MTKLCVNIDHIATIREARKTYEPDPVLAAQEARLGGADGITLHIREDRRHMQDHDLARLREAVQVPLNLEMAATGPMVELALRTMPDMVMLVPEGRHEITTEGGLDVVGDLERLRDAVSRLRAANLKVSAFIDADHDQIRAADAIGCEVCEIHTGPYALAVEKNGFSLTHDSVEEELDRIRKAGECIRSIGLQFNAGHGLNYLNVGRIASLEGLSELHIGHSIVSKCVFNGMQQSVEEMKRLIQEATR